MGSRTKITNATQPISTITAKWGYENIITSIDVFSRYKFAYPVSNPAAINTAKVNIDIMTRHAYLPTLIITDKRSVFLAQVIHGVAEILGINLKRATTKHAQTIGVLERAHATIKISLKMASGEERKQWHKYLPIEILNFTIPASILNQIEYFTAASHMNF